MLTCLHSRTVVGRAPASSVDIGATSPSGTETVGDRLSATTTGWVIGPPNRIRSVSRASVRERLSDRQNPCPPGVRAFNDLTWLMFRVLGWERLVDLVFWCRAWRDMRTKSEGGVR